MNISLTSGRPSERVHAEILKDFIEARFVRLRFQKIRSQPSDMQAINSTSIHDKGALNKVHMTTRFKYHLICFLLIPVVYVLYPARSEYRWSMYL